MTDRMSPRSPEGAIYGSNETPDTGEHGYMNTRLGMWLSEPRARRLGAVEIRGLLGIGYN